MYTQETLNNAITAVQAGLPLRTAALNFGIPRTTLARRIAAVKSVVLEKRSLSKTNVQVVSKAVSFGGYLQDALTNFNQGITDNYDVVLEQIRDNPLKSSELLRWYEEATKAAHRLDQRHGRMVDALLGVRWMEREPEVVGQFRKFVMSLVTANPVHLRSVIKALTACFVPDESIGEVPGREFSASRDSAHDIFNAIFSLIPQSLTVAEKVLVDNFPYMRKPVGTLASYAKNLLHVTTYRPSLRPPVLEVIIRNMVNLDVHSLRHEIEEAEADAKEEEEMFEMEEDLMKDPQTMKHDLADRLDVLMDILLQYIHDASYLHGELHLSSSRHLFRELLSVFDKVMLPVHQLSHVQFLLFWICSFKQDFYKAFVASCWKKVTDVSSPVTLRQASVCYVASFVARANFLPIALVKECLDTMVGWARRYMREATELPDTHRCDVARHGTFYSVCQAIFYIIIFRHQQILESQQGPKYMESLHLQHLVVSSLNPLKACLTSVVTLFSSAMRRHQLVYCDSVVERNNRQMLPVVGATMTSDNPLESFFPFDPYLLMRSRRFISGLYTPWSDGVLEQHNEEPGDISDDEFLEVVDGRYHFTSMEDSYKLLNTVSPGFGSPLSPP